LFDNTPRERNTLRILMIPTSCTLISSRRKCGIANKKLGRCRRRLLWSRCPMSCKLCWVHRLWMTASAHRSGLCRTRMRFAVRREIYPPAVRLYRGSTKGYSIHSLRSGFTGSVKRWNLDPACLVNAKKSVGCSCNGIISLGSVVLNADCRRRRLDVRYPSEL